MSNPECAPAWDRILRKKDHPTGIEIEYVVMGAESTFPGVHYFVRSSFGELAARLRDAAEVIRWEASTHAAFDPSRVAVLLLDRCLTAAQVEEAIFMAGRLGVGVEAYGGESLGHLDALTSRWGELV